MRCFKTVNDGYIEPVSFIVPRRAEMFQSDIYPPTTGLKAGTTAEEWFGGKTALPPKISLESVYDGEAPKEVASDYKPAQVSPAPTFSPTKSEAPKAAPEPSATPRGPPPQLKDNKDSLASQADKFADKDVDSDDESTSSFEEVAKPIQRPSTITAAKQEEKTMGAAPTKQAEPATSTSAPVAAPIERKSTPPASATPTPTFAPTPSAGGPASALRDALGDIKHQLEHQNKVMSDQSDQIALLIKEVGILKSKVTSAGPADREKDERIRQLELELEEARS